MIALNDIDDLPKIVKTLADKCGDQYKDRRYIRLSGRIVWAKHLQIN